MANARQQAARWSYSTGERGTNRVRAHDRGDRGIYLEWFEELAGGVRKRHSVALKHSDRDRAKEQADELALKFRRGESPVRELTLARLFDIYEREVTAHKGPSAQGHDRRCFEMFLRAFGADRKPSTLSRREWDRFIADRRAGRIAPPRAKPGTKVRDRIVQQDLQTLRAVLNWAALAGDGAGNALLERNPLAGLKLPREESPRRAVLSEEQYVAIRAAAKELEMPAWIDCLLVMMWEAGHRMASTRYLRWSDVDLEGKRIHWRDETDKMDNDHGVPLTSEAVTALRREQLRSGAIGDTWIFPSARKASLPASRDTVNRLWQRLATAAKIPKGKRYGWHSFRRRFANDLRHAPLRDLQDLGGWRSAQTLLTCYLQPDEAAQRTALDSRTRRAAEA